MRKTLALLLALAMLFTLAACTSAKAPDPTPTPTSTPEPTPTPTPVKTFWFDREVYIKNIDPVTESLGYSKFADIEPGIEQDSSEQWGDYTSYEYLFPTGIVVFFFETAEGDLIRIAFSGLAEYPDSYLHLLSLLTASAHAFGDGEDVLNRLNLDNKTENSTTTVKGTDYTYAYTVHDGILLFAVDP